MERALTTKNAKNTETKEPIKGRRAARFFRVIFYALFAFFAVKSVPVLPTRERSAWWPTAWGCLLALPLLLDLRRSLPLQNILVISTALFFGEGVVEWLLERDLSAVVLWLAALLAARKVTQIILRPWRLTGWYGVWLVALAAFLTALAQAAWHCTVEAVALRFATSVVLLIALVPWFIQKRPVTTSAEPTK